MKRVSKNLTKAVTLSVLLMLPYGMAWAKTFEYAITGADDTYTNYRTYDEKKDAYVYDFKGETTIKKETKDGYYGINANVNNIIINNKLNIDVTQGYNGSSAAAGHIYGIYANSGYIVDRRFGGDITLYGDDKGGTGVYVGESSKLLLGNGDITVTRNATKNAHFSDMPVGIDFSGGNGAIAVKGTGTIEVTDDRVDTEYNNKAGAYGIAFDYGDAGNTLILGYQGDYSDSDLKKFKEGNLKEIVAAENLGAVYIKTEAKTYDNTAKAEGISWNQEYQSDIEGSNIIVAGKLEITAKSTSNSELPDEALNSPYADVYKYNEISSASGIVNSQQWSQDENEEGYKSVDTNIVVKSVDIEAEATNNGNLFVAAYGINSNSKIENISASTTLLEASEIKATATGSGKVKANGILAEGNGLVVKYRIDDDYNPVYYQEYKDGGKVDVNTSDITITTTTNGGKEVENVGIKASGATVTINGTANITAIANDLAVKENNKVYGLWSTFGGNINVTGTTNISTSGGQDIAVVAGTENWTDVKDNPDGGTNNINLNYGVGSKITGDIISGYGGHIVIGTPESTEEGISTFSARNNSGTLTLKGDALSANGGKLDINLTAGSTWTGRADDYQDAALPTWKEEHEEQFNPKFSNSIEASGNVKVNLAQGAKWNVTGQSWVTELDGNGVINLTNGEGSDAVHIGKVKGNNTFVVNLKPDGLDTSDMLYIYDGTSAGVQNLRINNEAEVLNALKDDGDRIRFATVGKTAGAGAGFGDDYVVRGRGVINSGFSIDYVDYDTDTHQGNYNGGDSFTAAKPGDDYVDSIYGNGNNNGNSGETGNQASTLENNADTGSDPVVELDSKNLYLVRDSSKDAGKSDSGATIINMSRANYKNAIYMDRLNKRMGEMRYVNGEEEQGLWVRLRHDRIGQSGDFRSMNTMYEVGYDVKQSTDNGEHRIGMAIDYMRGSTTYDDIMGKGETKRYGLWLYDTWLGEKGHYTDYIVKWGHLSNDFDIRDKDSLENITGDYSNNVFSVSAEYGKKNDMGNNWYFEPQAQLQLARVTGADYVTTQGSKVNVDGINSLIGRAGFRIGRDMDENSTVYLKADLLHEFMGDQTVTAADATGTLREEFENKGTWYDVGFGFAAKMSKNSYAFMDFEKSFGNDNDETYQINAGMQWSF